MTTSTTTTAPYAELAAAMRGDLIMPGDPGYDQARAVYNAMDEGQDRVKASYRGNYDRLAQVKRRYDPDNMFHVNQNIQPAGQPGA